MMRTCVSASEGLSSLIAWLFVAVLCHIRIQLSSVWLAVFHLSSASRRVVRWDVSPDARDEPRSSGSLTQAEVSFLGVRHSHRYCDAEYKTVHRCKHRLRKNVGPSPLFQCLSSNICHLEEPVRGGSRITHMRKTEIDGFCLSERFERFEHKPVRSLSFLDGERGLWLFPLHSVCDSPGLAV